MNNVFAQRRRPRPDSPTTAAIVKSNLFDGSITEEQARTVYVPARQAAE